MIPALMNKHLNFKKNVLEIYIIEDNYRKF